MLQSRCSPCGALCAPSRAPAAVAVAPQCSTVVRQHHRAALRRVRSQTEEAPAGTEPATIPLDEESETARKKAEAERLRAAEKFMVVGAGNATCTGCGYEYKPEKGDPDFPIPKGMNFQDVPADYFCPICGAPKSKFEAQIKVVAGFAENQKYGLGTNSMTGEQKSLLIYGSLALFFLLFIAGYGLN